MPGFSDPTVRSSIGKDTCVERVVPTTAPSAAPLLAVDELSVNPAEGGLEVRARKRVHDRDPFLAAHFPGFTVYPGFFMVETLRQAVVLACDEERGGRPEIVAIHSARFLAPVPGGDGFELEALVPPPDQCGSFVVSAVCRRDDGTTAATLKVGFRYRKTLDA